MGTVEIRLIGTREECLTLIVLLGQLAPVMVTANKPANPPGAPGPPRRRVYAEIHTRLRDNR